MKKLLFIGVALGLFLTSCHKKDHCKEEVQIMHCGTEEDHKDWDKEGYDKSDYYSDDIKEDKDWDKEGEWKDEKDWDKEDKKWWWKKKKGYDMDDCDDVYPGKN